ncbi:AMP-binding protein, partial [Burkholderia pseudomallei]|uniref:AMP-binding protein n=1 Tax=Burkholderia pseudomallei TaxID=28450 RepID=UPI001178A9A2
ARERGRGARGRPPARRARADAAHADALLRLGGGPAAPWAGAPVHRQIERIAHADPQALALAGEDGARIGYAVLNATANRLARRLRTLGVAPRDAVALCMRPGPSFALAALAVLKLGAAYVPIDPRYPDPRKLRIVADSGARLVVAEPGAAPARTPDGPARPRRGARAP